MSQAGSGDVYESVAETDKTPDAVVAYWRSEDEMAEKELSAWRKRGRKIVKRYLDERASGNSRTRLNMLWANVQVLAPVLYARTPKPEVAPRWRDDPDPVTRLASEILNRGLNYQTEIYDFDSVMRHCVEDRLLPGAGCARVRYVPEFGEGDEVTGERAACEYVHWDDFTWSPARTWETVRWVRFTSYLTRDELEARFGAEIAKKVNLDWSPSGMDKDTENVPDVFKKATVREYWDKRKKQVVWIADGYHSSALDIKDDPLRLPDFFPCPRPLLANTTTSKLVPVPDFIQYQDQANQIDDLSARIGKLEDALVAKGAYPAAEKDTLTKLVNAQETVLVPVDDWALFGTKAGGPAGNGFIIWWPIDQIAKVLTQLYAAREMAKQSLYEVTGLSDIMRGASQPHETATAQTLKSQYGTIRVQDSQKDVARFARDLFRLLAVVMSEHFAPQTLSQITGLPELPPPPQFQPLPPDPAMMQEAMQQQAALQQSYEAAKGAAEQQFAQAAALLDHDLMRGYRVDIESDSTIAPDEAAEKAARIEFLTSIGQLITNATPLLQAMPSSAEFVGAALQFASRGFRTARPLADTIDRFVESIKNQPPPQPEADPAAAQMAEVDGNLQIAQKQAETGMQIEVMKAQSAVEIKRAEFAADIEMEQQKTMAKIELERHVAEAKLVLEQQMAKARLQTERGSALAKSELDREISGVQEQAGKAQEQESALAGSHEAIEKILELLLQQASASGEAVAALTQIMTAPKVVVRDKSNRVVGIQTEGMPMRRTVRDESGRLTGLN